MKMLNVFLLICFIFAYSDDTMQKIYQEASEIVDEDFERDEDEILVEFYSEKIEEMDLEVLKKNPELIFRRACAWFKILDPVEYMEDFFSQLKQLKQDFKFVMDNSEEKSQIFLAADSNYQFIDLILKSCPKSEEDFFDRYLEFSDNILRRWATDPSASGKKLREDVFLNVERDPTIAQSFYDFVLRNEKDPDIALGYIKPDRIRISCIIPYENEKFTLLYRIEFSEPKMDIINGEM
ncbi:MAG: hypothetical protein AMS24_03055 [Chlamydiae bacterium SM23_39]|nr:MAG: hypothetical protein AMS24_03055 [Chlamydiae bacterium SM23_39]